MKFNYDKIFESQIGINQEAGYKPIYKEEIIAFGKEVLRKAIPIILKDVDDFVNVTDDPESILNREEPLKKLFGL